MCRMFFQCSTEPFNIQNNFLEKFVKTCHWQYLRKYNLYGHHGLGWGFAYIPENTNSKLIIKRDITPIYHSDWKNLVKIKTRFLLVHARRAYPWNKCFNDVHPINIDEKYLIVHNGVIKNKSFPKLINPKLEDIKNNTRLDTRKYLCYIIDQLNMEHDLKSSLEKVFKKIEIAAGANAFLFNSKECNIITYHNTNFNGRHHTLFISKNLDRVTVSTTPILSGAKEIPNNSLIQINLKKLNMNITKLNK
ncbi:MAG: class II glutamine amidotransferase [Promethearchaeota archaeon]